MHMANEQYQQNNHKWKTWPVDSWASRLWRGTGIELVFKSLDCFTLRPIFSTRPITRIKSFSFFLFIFFFEGGGAQLQCIYYLVLYTDRKAAEGN